MHSTQGIYPSRERPRVLVADDELSLREVLSIFLEQSGFDVTCATHADEACELIAQKDFCLVLSDLRMPRGGGLRVLEFMRDQESEALAIMMTAYASTETAVEAMKLGAHDYLTKPFQLEALKVLLDRALEHYTLRQENRKLKETIQAQARFEGLIGRSEPMRHIFEIIQRVAAAKTPVLVLGESGTGKEMVAKAIHAQSNRSQGPFVALNCAALPEHLLESSLFGHRRGAFTGATDHHQGLFQAANEGTLFLDEIGEMPLAMQAKVLRALQEQKVMAVGSIKEEDVNLRVIAATNRPLLEEVKAGRFREDLYYRLNVIPLHLPPLRERPSDIPLLAEHFLRHYATEFGKEIDRVSPSVMSALVSSQFPGNVRELKNLIERAVALSTSDELSAQDFLWESVASAPIDPHAHEQSSVSSLSDVSVQSLRSNQHGSGYDYPKISLDDHAMIPQDLSAIALLISELDDSALDEDQWDLDHKLEEIERALIREMLDRCQGNRTSAAKMLNLSFRSLRYRLKKLNLDA